MASSPSIEDSARSPEQQRKKKPNYNVERIIGLPAGICSGVTKLLVGHPFG
ncbi:hypothetical protein HDU96_000479 [Phlyctochytrium bullatum]|nr:hypothetical protein HDU96_000479 [Phlyctochytrium bullatum]